MIQPSVRFLNFCVIIFISSTTLILSSLCLRDRSQHGRPFCQATIRTRRMMMVEARRRNPVTPLTMEVPMRRSTQLCRFSKKEVIVMEKNRRSSQRSALLLREVVYQGKWKRSWHPDPQKRMIQIPSCLIPTTLYSMASKRVWVRCNCCYSC